MVVKLRMGFKALMLAVKLRTGFTEPFDDTEVLLAGQAGDGIDRFPSAKGAREVVEPAIDQLHTDAIQGQLQSLRQR